MRTLQDIKRCVSSGSIATIVSYIVVYNLCKRTTGCSLLVNINNMDAIAAGKYIEARGDKQIIPNITNNISPTYS
jgi:hypothetical protein